MTGNALTRVAVPWYVLSTSGSAAQVGLALFFETLPLYFGSFFGGVLVDGDRYFALALTARQAGRRATRALPWPPGWHLLVECRAHTHYSERNASCRKPNLS
jgi:hypothetical protein